MKPVTFSSPHHTPTHTFDYFLEYLWIASLLTITYWWSVRGSLGNLMNGLIIETKDMGCQAIDIKIKKTRTRERARELLFCMLFY